MARSSPKRRVGLIGERAADPAPTAPAPPRASGVVLRDEAAGGDREAILLLAEELGKLAADLWFAGKLDALPAEDEGPDHAEED